MKNFSLPISTLLAFAIVLVFADDAEARNFKKLTADGYAVGELTRNAGGKWGWYLQKQEMRYFCRMGRVSIVRVGANGLATFTSSGRLISMDKDTFVANVGVNEYQKLPRYENLQSGSVEAGLVGRCAKA
ncbi:MAG: hypothetical protein AAF940_06875 [Pseudomonadota bacterium]